METINNFSIPNIILSSLNLKFSYFSLLISRFTGQLHHHYLSGRMTTAIFFIVYLKTWSWHDYATHSHIQTSVGGGS